MGDLPKKENMILGFLEERCVFSLLAGHPLFSFLSFFLYHRKP